MKKTLFRMSAAGIAVAFSLLTTADGLKVLLGINVPEYIVMRPLLIYNVIMGVLGAIVGSALWLKGEKALKYAVAVASMHLIVLALTSMMHLFGGAVALHSVHAMGLRALVWLAVVWLARISNSASATVK